MIAGLLTLIPVAVTFFIVKFVYDLLGVIGRPLVEAFANHMGNDYPQLNALLHTPWAQTVAFVLFLLISLYMLGVVATHVLGSRLVALFDAIMSRIPFIETIYGAARKFVDVLKNKPGNGMKRVVLINFPNERMKAIGFVTKTMTDVATGRELVVVYVPTAPNPTSGYMEILAAEDVTPTDWTMDEAMTFIISGGAVAPDKVHFAR